MNDNPAFIFGAVLPAIQDYRRLVRAIASSPFVVATDFSYTAPIYKGSDAIKQGLERANTAIEKFDVYFYHALLNPNERLRFGQLFAAAYLKRFPASERQDLFTASGDVLKLGFELLPPRSLEDATDVVELLAQTPHDPRIIEQLRAKRPVDHNALRVDLKIFLDDVHNRRRRDVEAVRAAMAQLDAPDPVVVELWSNGALPGYVHYVMTPLVHGVGGAFVLLPG